MAKVLGGGDLSIFFLGPSCSITGPPSGGGTLVHYPKEYIWLFKTRNHTDVEEYVRQKVADSSHMFLSPANMCYSPSSCARR